jgi:hypothetical protein
MLFVSIVHSRSTLSQSEDILDSLVAIDYFQWHRQGCYPLQAYVVLRSFDSSNTSPLTLYWPSSSTLFVVLTLEYSWTLRTSL